MSNGSQSQYLSRCILDHILGGPPYVPPSMLYVALGLSGYDATADGSTMNEVTGAGYARVALTNDSSTWPSASDTLPSGKAALIQITFPSPLASWGIPTSVWILDAATPGTGNVLYGSPISNTTELVPGGQPFSIYAGTFVFTED